MKLGIITVWVEFKGMNYNSILISEEKKELSVSFFITCIILLKSDEAQKQKIVDQSKLWIKISSDKF